MGRVKATYPALHTYQSAHLSPSYELPCRLAILSTTNTGITKVRFQTSAEALVRSYASAMHTAQEPEATTCCCADTPGVSYFLDLTTNVCDYHNTIAKQGEWMAGSSLSLEKYDQSDNGLRCPPRRVNS